MKFTYIAMIACASAIQMETPKESYAAKAANLAEGLEVVAGQQAFEKKHVSDHAAAMAQWDKDAKDERMRIRTKRINQLKTSWMKE